MSDDVRTDVEARRRAADEFATTFLVEAGAGTGKTTVLLSRLLAALRSGRSRVDRLAAITFSEKAAAEIRVRLRTELELALAGPLADDERANLRNAHWQLERAQITTVHAFCAALLRERPVEARVDPQFSTLSQFEARLVQTTVWQEWLAQEMDRGPTVLKQALRAGLGFTHIETLRDFVLEQRDCLTLLPAPAPSSVAELRVRIPQLLAELSKQKSSCRTATDRAFAHIQRLEMLVPKDDDLRLWEQFVLHEPREIVAGATVGSKTNWRPATVLEDVRTLFRQVAGIYTEARTDWLHNLSLGLVRWLEGYVRAYNDKKREQSQLDFTDLLLLTRDLLKSNLDVRRYFQRRFDCLLVDEFQDTDPLQAEIVFFLAEQEPRAARWFDVTLRPGKLFLVGDPQQSIYRFRRADLDVYSQVRAAVTRQGEVLILADNFRTRAPVLGWMNKTFALAFAETTSDQPPYQPLAATRKETTGRDLIAVPIPAAILPARPTRGDLRRAEARTIAAVLKQAVTYGSLAAWGDKAKEYRDVAVLFRTYRAMEAYEEAFANAGIPYRVLGGRRYASRHEVEDLRALLLAVERPTDPSLIVAVLRSSMFGFSDEELAQFVSEGGKFDALRPVVPDVLSAERFAVALATVRELYRDAAELSPAALLYKLYNSTHLIPLFAVRPHGAQRVANLLKLIDIAQALAPHGVQTLVAFNRFLAQQDVAGEEEEAVLTEEDDNAVRLLTVHKAKGLEFPVVILADMADRPSRGRIGKTGIVERLGGTLELRIGPQTLTCATRGWQKAESREQEREAAEEWRLRYVAAARVRDHLLMPLWPNIERETGDVGERPEPDNDDARKAGNVAAFSLSGAEHVYTYHVDPAQIETVAPSFPPPPVITGVLPNAASLRAYERWQAERRAIIEKGRAHAAWDVIPVPSVFPSQKPVADMERKAAVPVTSTLRQALWTSLQEMLAHPEKSVHEIAKATGSTGAEQREIEHALLHLRTSGLFARVAAARERWSGLPFTLHHEGRLWNGTIDLAFFAHDAWVIGHFLLAVLADTQTPSIAEVSKTPLFLHAFAFERLTGQRVQEVVLAAVRSGEVTTVTWGDAGRNSVAAELSRFSSFGGARQ
jgi:ATP-dependent helicase/nuclease subunit A